MPVVSALVVRASTIIPVAVSVGLLLPGRGRGWFSGIRSILCVKRLLWDVSSSLLRWVRSGCYCTCNGVNFGYTWWVASDGLIELLPLVLVALPAQGIDVFLFPFGPRVNIPFGFVRATLALGWGACIVAAFGCACCRLPALSSRGGCAGGCTPVQFV